MFPIRFLSEGARITGTMKRSYFSETTRRIARLVPAVVLLVLSFHYFGTVYAIIGDSIRITGGFDTFEAVLLLWAVAPWALLVTGLAHDHGLSRHFPSDAVDHRSWCPPRPDPDQAQRTRPRT